MTGRCETCRYAVSAPDIGQDWIFYRVPLPPMLVGMVDMKQPFAKKTYGCALHEEGK